MSSDMSRVYRRRPHELLCLGAALCALTIASAVGGPADSEAIAVKTTAEVETRVLLHGHEAVQLAPADRVVPGDQVIYTVEIRNTRVAAVPVPVVRYEIPEHMRYVPDSAVAPGADVSYSVDGGRTFDRPDHLTVAGPGGGMRAASAADYTHIRWQLKHALKGHAVAFARFRAVVK
jgi:uncharacterized repeat protein (TIGR01451 family)